ncbi:FAD-binding protein [Nakamurella alba]|nr:FAD-binding protein [Nakamurella alba]
MAINTSDLEGLDYTVAPTWSNGTRNIQATPSVLVRPRDETEVARIVKFARRHRLPVRPVGGGYSWMPLVTTGGIIMDLQFLTGVVSVDLPNRRARVRAGTRLYDLNERLWDQGAAMIQLGAWAGQTIAGVVGTGTHGTSTTLGNIASFVRAVRMVNGEGEIVELVQGDADLEAVRVSMGLFGIMVEIELEVAPAYHLAQDGGFHPWEKAGELIFADAGNYRHLAALWAPHEKSFESVRFPAGPGLGDHFYLQRFYEPDPARTDQAVDRSYRVLSFASITQPLGEYIELEYGIPVERTEEAANATRTLLREEFPFFIGPMYNRFIAADSAYLSPFSDRDSATVSISSSPLFEFWPVFEAVHRLLVERFEARPHWGKINFFEGEDLEKAFPRYQDFVAARRRFDPDGVFLNEYGRANFV